MTFWSPLPVVLHGETVKVRGRLHSINASEFERIVMN